MRDALGAFAGGLIVVTALSLAILTVVQRSDDTGAPAPASVAEVMTCPDGATVLSAYRQEANAFLVVGRLNAVEDDGSVRVDAPIGEVTVGLAGGASVDIGFETGDPVLLSGRVAADGGLEATEVRSGCGGTFVSEPEASPQPTPEEGAAVSNVTPVPTPPVPPPPTQPPPVQIDAPPPATAVPAPTPEPSVRAPAGLPGSPPPTPVLPTPTPTPAPSPEPASPTATPRGPQPAAETPYPLGVVAEPGPPHE